MANTFQSLQKLATSLAPKLVTTPAAPTPTPTTPTGVSAPAPTASSDDKYSGPADASGATVVEHDPLFTSTPEPAKPARISVPVNPEAAKTVLTGPPASAPLIPKPLAPELPTTDNVIEQLLFVTGQPGVGISELLKQIDAVEISARESAELLLANLLGRRLEPTLPQLPTILSALVNIGNGNIASYADVVLVTAARQQPGYENFGNPGFWIDELVAVARKMGTGSRRIAITGVDSLSEFKRLHAEHFQHWHVMCAPSERDQAIPGTPFATSLDNNVFKQVSERPTGNRLHCIWTGNTPIKTNRLWLTSDFIVAASVQPAPTEATDEVTIS